MEKPFDTSEEQTRKLIKSGGLHTPSTNFSNSVMKVIEARKVIALCYKPLISRKIWIGIAFVAAGIVAFFFLFPTLQSFQFIPSEFIEKLSFTIPSYTFHFSKTVLYGISFLALFIIQIPFLKHLLSEK